MFGSLPFDRLFSPGDSIQALAQVRRLLPSELKGEIKCPEGLGSAWNLRAVLGTDIGTARSELLLLIVMTLADRGEHQFSTSIHSQKLSSAISPR